ncbi:MAG: pilus assembly protein TadG-related protein [Aestuariivirga sp.]
MRAIRGHTKSWKALLSKFVTTSRGMTAITFAALAPFMLGAFGIASDSATFVMKRNSLQTIADAAALAAAKELAIASNGQAEIEAVAEAAAAALGPDSPNAEVTVTVNRQESTVHVAVAETWMPFFAHFIKTGVTPIRTSATAMLAGMANVCVLTLEKNAADGIRMTKSARVTAADCGIYANSTHAQAVRLDDQSSISADMICSAGGVLAKSSAINPAPTTDCPQVPDPLSNRAPPSYGGCDQIAKAVANGNVTLDPGVYCAGLAISGKAKVTLNPGIYVMKDGPLSITGQGSVTGAHVGFYLDGALSVLEFSGNAVVDLTGPKDGNMAGLLFFESRDMPLGTLHRIKGEMVKRLTGTIYLPHGYLLIDPKSRVAENSAYTAIITRRLEVREGPELILNSDYDATDVPVPQGIRATTQVVLTQ